MPRTCCGARWSWRRAGPPRGQILRWCSDAWDGRRKRWRYSTTFSPKSRIEVGHWNLKAATLGRLGDFEEAIALYEEVLARAPNKPRVWVSYGHMLKTVGRQARGHCRLSQGDRSQPGARRGVVEPRQSQDRQVHRGRCRGHAATRWSRPIFRTTTASISILRSARRCMMLAAPTRRSRTMRTGTRCGGKYHPHRRDEIQRTVDRSIAGFTSRYPDERGAVVTPPTRSSSSECREQARR